MSLFSFYMTIMTILLFYSSFVTACVDDERRYLRDFRGALDDPSGRLNSWQQFNCCQWHGVICDYHSGHVISLDLTAISDPIALSRGSFNPSDGQFSLNGKIHPALFNLKHLQHLDLSGNHLDGAFSSQLGKLQKLIFLNLADAANGREEIIPVELSNMTTLRHLDLSLNPFIDTVIPSQLGKLKNLTFLSLRSCGVGGEIPPELGNITSLRYLDLSGNSFNGTVIPPELGKLERLTFLELAAAEFGAEIPPELGNMTALHYLDLSGHRFGNEYLLAHEVESQRFAGLIRNLLNLEYLRMGDVNLSMASQDWGNALSGLSNLREIDLSNCGISGAIPSLQNLTHLFDLSLSGNPFYSPLPSWFQNTSAMVSLDLSDCDLIRSLPPNFLPSSKMRKIDLSHNHLVAAIPPSIANISTLETLDFSYNDFTGDLHRFFSFVDRHLHLRSLYLNNNQLCGAIPDTISKFIRLERLSLSSNNLTAISPSVLEMPYLKEVYLSENHLELGISPTWIPQHVKLEYLELKSCNVQGEIPAFLSTQYSLEGLDLSDNNIGGSIPTWLWDLSNLQVLNLSHNNLEGSLPTAISMEFDTLDMHNNSLYGSIPDFHSAAILDMSENKFTGSIPDTLCSIMGFWWMLLDLSKNELSGAVPRNLLTCSELLILNLAQNKLEGEIPEELGNLIRLQTLNLNQNNFEGFIPPSIANCTQLRVLDLGNNRIQGSIPIAIGMLQDLRILNLGFNKLQGGFLPELLSLKNLQILDLSHNNFSGFIPPSLGRFNAMANQTRSGEIDTSGDEGFGGRDVGPSTLISSLNQITVWIKGRSLLYPKILKDFKLMDLSHNKFAGNIPEEVGELKGLIALNISNNKMRGGIPESMAGMTQLESLDLSRNMLSGNIPADLANLTSLSVLNLSYNNLSGYIPQGKQFATFEASSYVGNPNLHGWPLENGKLRAGRGEGNGQGGKNSTGVTDTNGDQADRWWAVAVGLSFGVGFGSIIAALSFHLQLRYRCFTLMDNFIQYIFER